MKCWPIHQHGFEETGISIDLSDLSVRHILRQAKKARSFQFPNLNYDKSLETTSFWDASGHLPTGKYCDKGGKEYLTTGSWTTIITLYEISLVACTSWSRMKNSRSPGIFCAFCFNTLSIDNCRLHLQQHSAGQRDIHPGRHGTSYASRNWSLWTTETSFVYDYSAIVCAFWQTVPQNTTHRAIGYNKSSRMIKNGME